MFIDYNLVLADGQSLSTTGASTSYIDTLAAGDGIDEGAWLIILVKTAFVGPTSVKFDLRTDSVSTFPTDTVLFSTGAILTASLTANTFIAKVRMPLGAKRYLRGYATFAGPAGSAGTFDMKIVKDVSRDVNKIGVGI